MPLPVSIGLFASLSISRFMQKFSSETLHDYELVLRGRTLSILWLILLNVTDWQPICAFDACH